jgi:hypothetical protein
MFPKQSQGRDHAASKRHTQNQDLTTSDWVSASAFLLANISAPPATAFVLSFPRTLTVTAGLSGVV